MALAACRGRLTASRVRGTSHGLACSAVAARRRPQSDVSTGGPNYYLHGHDHKQQPRRGRWIPAAKATPELTVSQAEEFGSKLVALAAEISKLPPDLASQHDHYLHGLPKR